MDRAHLYFANCGDGETRKWKDCLIHGFISAGQGDLEGCKPGYFSKQLIKLKVGDILAVYFNGKGYVGIGRVISERMDVNIAILNGEKVTPKTFLSKGMFRNHDNKSDFKEYLIAVEWLTECISDPEINGGKCYGGHTPRNVIATLEKPNKKELRRKLELAFKISFKDYLPYYGN